MTLAAQRGMGCKMCLPTIFLTIWEYRLWVSTWLFFFTVAITAAPIISIITKDLYGWILWIFMSPIFITNAYLVAGYYGLTKSMGLIHLPSLIGFLSYSSLRYLKIFNSIEYNKDTLLFVYGIILMCFLSICLFFDIMDTYVWYIKKDKIVMRNKSTVEKMISLGLLPMHTQPMQAICENGKWLLDDQYDSWGLLKPS